LLAIRASAHEYAFDRRVDGCAQAKSDFIADVQNRIAASADVTRGAIMVD
jgi:hypothetical protein